MNQHIKQHIRRCPTCLLCKHSTSLPTTKLCPIPPPAQPFQEYLVDIVSGFPITKKGPKYITCVVDRFSKMLWTFPSSSMPTSHSIWRDMDTHIFKNNGYPTKLISDRGSQFTSSKWLAYNLKVNSNVALSSSYHPQTDGCAERVIQSLCTILRCLKTDHPNTPWYDFIQKATYIYNTGVHSSTKFAPILLAFKGEPNLLHTKFNTVSDEQHLLNLRQAATNLLTSSSKMKQFYDTKRNDNLRFQVGDLVLLSTHNLHGPNGPNKLSIKFVGPYQITEKIGPCTYKLDLKNKHGRIHPVFHESLLRAYPLANNGKM
jgi:transposase InsO family protein